MLPGWGLRQRFSTQGDLASTGDIWQCLFWLSELGFSWVEARDTTKYPTMFRVAPHNKESPRLKYQ